LTDFVGLGFSFFFFLFLRGGGEIERERDKQTETENVSKKGEEFYEYRTLLYFLMLKMTNLLCI
jgi:hypothetical protein